MFVNHGKKEPSSTQNLLSCDQPNARITTSALFPRSPHGIFSVTVEQCFRKELKGQVDFLVILTLKKQSRTST